MTFRSNTGSGGGASFGPPSGDVAIGNVENTGTSPDVPHADHTHAFPAAVGLSAALSAAAGSKEE